MQSPKIMANLTIHFHLYYVIFWTISAIYTTILIIQVFGKDKRKIEKKREYQNNFSCGKNFNREKKNDAHNNKKVNTVKKIMVDHKV